MQFASGHHPNRTAFSLVELLVVISITGALVALVLLGISASRASSRKLTCLNHCRQLGLALQMHHEQKGQFPPGGIEWRPAGKTTYRQLAWSVFVLPYLEQQTVYDQMDLEQPFDSPRNAWAASQILPVFICPASSRGAVRVQGRGPCDFGGIYGERIQGPNQPPKGLMIYDRAFRDTEVSDGLSTTLILGEDSAWPDGQWINGRNVFDQAFAINRAPSFENDIRSQHGAGAHGVFADGRAVFLGETIDLPVLAALCTRAGREVIPDDSL